MAGKLSRLKPARFSTMMFIVVFMALCAGFGGFWGLRETAATNYLREAHTSLQLVLGDHYQWLLPITLTALVVGAASVVLVALAGVMDQNATCRTILAALDQVPNVVTRKTLAGNIRRDPATRFMPWAEFSRLLRYQKSVARTHKRPFALVHWSIEPKADCGYVPRFVRDSLANAFDVHLQSCDAVGESRRGSWILLMPEATNDKAEQTNQKIASEITRQLGEEYRMNIRQFAYTPGEDKPTVRRSNRAVA